MMLHIRRLLARALIFLLLCTGSLAEGQTVLTLPASLKTIDKEAFSGSTAIEKVIVPDGAAEIGSRAFADSSLSAIDLPASLTVIADDAFDGCGNLDVSAPEDSYAHDWAVEKGYIALPTPAEYFSYEITGSEATITGYTGTDEEVIIPSVIEGSPVTRIGMYAFYGNETITHVKIPKSVTAIENYAFCECTRLAAIHLPASIASIGSGALEACPLLTDITVDTANPHFTVLDGVLYTGDLSALVCYPAGKLTEGVYSIVSGDSADLSSLMNAPVSGITSSRPELVSVNGTTITAASGAAGRAVITMTAGETNFICTIDVIAAAGVSLPQEDIQLRPLSTVAILFSPVPANLIGTFTCEPADATMIAFDPANGEITAFETPGSTEIIFTTYNAQFSLPVTVLEAPDYRALVISSYHGYGASTDLPFAGNNVSTLQNTLAKSVVLNKQYSVTTAKNPSKSSVKNLITTTFADASDDDVSLIYITTHGHNRDTGTGYNGYYFSLAPDYAMSDPDTYVKASELMDWLSTINGNVVLILDSCYSGAFIQACSGRLAAQGNISVLTAQEGDKPAGYYVGKTSATHAEFLTFAFCYGLGVQMTDITLENMPADRNGDYQVTIDEAFSYGRSYAVNLIESYRDTYSASSKYGIKSPGINTQAKFDAWYQNPQIYLAPGAEALVIYGR